MGGKCSTWGLFGAGQGKESGMGLFCCCVNPKGGEQDPTSLPVQHGSQYQPASALGGAQIPISAWHEHLGVAQTRKSPSGSGLSLLFSLSGSSWSNSSRRRWHHFSNKH